MEVLRRLGSFPHIRTVLSATWRCCNSLLKRKRKPPGRRKSGGPNCCGSQAHVGFTQQGEAKGCSRSSGRQTRHCLGKKSRRCGPEGGLGRRGGVGAIFLGPCRGMCQLFREASGRFAESPHEMGRTVPWLFNCRLAPENVGQVGRVGHQREWSLAAPRSEKRFDTTFDWHRRRLCEWVRGILAKWNVSRRLSESSPTTTERSAHQELSPSGRLLATRTEEAQIATCFQRAAEGRPKGKGKGTFLLKAQPKLAATPEARVVSAAAKARRACQVNRRNNGTSEVRSKRQCWASRVDVGGSRWFAQDEGGSENGHGLAKWPWLRTK